MDIRSQPLERRVLLLSVVGAAVFAAGAITMGLLARSQFLLFDGLYSLVSVAASAMSLMASRFMAQEDGQRFPFGKLSVEPLVVGVKYVMILVIITASAVSAAISLFTGGRPVALGLAVTYSFVSTAACWAVAVYIRRRDSQSNLLRAEGNQWLMDTWISGAASAAFAGALVLSRIPSGQSLIPYLDPVMVLAGSLYFVRVPLAAIGQALRELLDMAPDAALQTQVQDAVNSIERSYGFRESYVRMSTVSRRLWVEVDFVVQASTKMRTVAEGDQIREELFQKLQSVDLEKWLTVSFTADRKWAQ